MGAVYLARDLRLERDVAMKILTARSLGRPDEVKEAATEAATANREVADRTRRRWSHSSHSV